MDMYPSTINLRAGVLVAPPFAMRDTEQPGVNKYHGFSLDLLDRLQILAQSDGVSLHFNLSETPSQQYGPALDLVANDCHDHVVVKSKNSSDSGVCEQFDMILGDYYCNPDRSDRVDFTPAWLRTTMTTLKYTTTSGEEGEGGGGGSSEQNNNNNNRKSFDTMAQLEGAGGTACVPEGAYLSTVAIQHFPLAEYYHCPHPDDCIDKLKANHCQLYVDDELLLRYRVLSDPTLQLNRESFNTQYLVYPMRYDLPEITRRLMKRWMYAAIANATLDELYYEYFEFHTCPVGTAGENCELPCHPKHGESNKYGVCVCESTKWIGADCSIEVLHNPHWIPNPLKTTGYVLVGTAVAAILGCMIWLLIHQRKSQVKNRQPPLLGVVLVGCLLSTCTILAMAQAESEEGLGDDNDDDGPVVVLHACRIIPWLYSVGFTLTFATLGAKMWRIKQLFDGAARMQRIAVTVGQAMTKVCIVLVLDIILLTVWTAVDPLYWTRDVLLTDKYGAILQSQGYCTSNYFTIFASLLAVLHFGILAVGSYYCYLSWSIPTQFSEGKFVGVAILANLQVFLLGIPILLIVGSDTDTSFFARTAMIWINNITVVGFVFGNLIYATHNDRVVAMTSRTAIQSFVEKQQSMGYLSDLDHSSTGRQSTTTGTRRKQRDSMFSYRFGDADDSNDRPVDDWTNDLITAAAKGDLASLILLLAETEVALSSDRVNVHSKADINAGDYDRRTALHLAAGEGHIEIVEELCARGANVNAEDRWGGRPMDDAVRSGNSLCAEILAKYGGKVGIRHSKGTKGQPQPASSSNSWKDSSDESDDGKDDGTSNTSANEILPDKNKTTIPDRAKMKGSSFNNAV